MATREESIKIHGESHIVFDVLHDYTRRLCWDPFLREARLTGGANRAEKGVVVVCSAKWRAGGMSMETEYVTFDRPRVAAVKMTQGPRFFDCFAATIRQQNLSGGITRVTYKYHLKTRPRWLRFLLEPVFHVMFSRETKRRLTALKRVIENNEMARNAP